MATVAIANPVSANTAPVQTSNLKVPYMVWNEVDLAAAITAKGSALAQGDVIEAIRIPANHAVIAVFAKKTGASAGTSTDVTFDIGITGGDVDNFVDGWDFDGAAVGSYATPLGVLEPVVSTTSDTVDILIATQTNTLTAGKVTVYAMVVDLGTQSRGAIAQPRS